MSTPQPTTNPYYSQIGILQLNRRRGELVTAVEARFSDDVGLVVLDGVVALVEFVGDLRIGTPPGNEVEHLNFYGAEIKKVGGCFFGTGCMVLAQDVGTGKKGDLALPDKIFDERKNVAFGDNGRDADSFQEGGSGLLTKTHCH